MALLKTNYKDDILLDTSGKRKYTMITNDDGTVSFVDVTDYSQNGDAFGAADINATNTEVNEHFASVDKSLEALNSNTEILTGTLGEQNVTTYLSFPDGYNSTNCMIISIMAYVDSNYVGNAINFNWVYVNLESSRIAIVSRDASVVGKTFKLLLQKTK